MNNISLRQIRTFLAIVETGSFRKASERVHLSQPAVTAHIRQLEEQIGIPLLDRTTRRVRTTPAGERFRFRTERLLAELRDVVDELKDEAELQRGRVAVACVPTIASRFLPDALASFRHQFPGISVSIDDVVAAEIYEMLADAKADIGIGPRPERGADYDFQLLARDPFVAVVPRDHPWTRRRSVSLADLSKVPFLAMSRDSNVRSLLENAFATKSLQVTPRFETRHHYTLGGMVEAGLGVTVLPSMAVSLLSQPLLQTVPVTRPAIYRDVGVIMLKGRKPSPASEAFVGVVKQQLHARQGLRQPPRTGE